MSGGAAGAGLSARLRVARGAFRLALDLDVAPGEVVALLGPNGAGKSTVLAALAGLLPADGSEVVLDGRALEGGASAGGPAAQRPATQGPAAQRPALRTVPARDRDVGTVFQDYRLFPHLTALENVAFGLRARGVPATGARARARDELARVGLADEAGRRPGELSGGQSQRVAVARALAADPRLLLLDEPLAALDAGARAELRAALAELLHGVAVPTVLVTHDPVDAVALARRVVVLERGAAVQHGRPTAALLDPHTPYVASLTGATVWAPEAVHEGPGTLTAELPGGLRLTSTRPRASAGPPRVAFPAEALTLSAPDRGAAGRVSALSDLPAGGAVPAALAARVVRTEQRLSRLAVLVATDRGGHLATAEVPLGDADPAVLRAGAPVTVTVDPGLVTIR
ncbi:molybdate transport system ATP-binding protein [Frigoribacterium sp. PvP120]|uniref:ATP-binding cassette domain-containing protein n=1 Tax=unclassified Frigoribacterium TaxID=2627005 RepID=UPI001B467517|nr:ATP-binding cassette domain-containing protein [Frigoribacterium sp. PvP121]MBP1242619.1 molybdate transport system ATP-binding protein [Frigoribacterium sp. PvP121]